MLPFSFDSQLSVIPVIFPYPFGEWCIYLPVLCSFWDMRVLTMDILQSGRAVSKCLVEKRQLPGTEPINVSP